MEKTKGETPDEEQLGKKVILFKQEALQNITETIGHINGLMFECTLCVTKEGIVLRPGPAPKDTQGDIIIIDQISPTFEGLMGEDSPWVHSLADKAVIAYEALIYDDRCLRCLEPITPPSKDEPSRDFSDPFGTYKIICLECGTTGIWNKEMKRIQ